MRGLEQLMTDFIEDPDLADAILDIPYKYHLIAAETLAGMGVESRSGWTYSTRSSRQPWTLRA